MMKRTRCVLLHKRATATRLRCLAHHLSGPAIRKSFLDFFCGDHDHFYIRSSPVFSARDPTLAFVNAGMNQFKDVFLGLVNVAANRVANYQKCIRIGGKHNDLSQVGRDGSHHSFFEMLGNWSFGDYFKKEACQMSWDLLTRVYGLPSERLYVTYFGGNEKLSLDADLEVQQIWREIGVKENHILPFGARDNFWEMGRSGPCGPCTEIHYDRIPSRSNAGDVVNSGTSDLVELWNLVFLQYNRQADGSLEKLATHFVDTGMGFERLVAVLQGKMCNYDTDLFSPLFEAISRHTGHTGYTGEYGRNKVDLGYRILADHARLITVALSDGMIPNHQNKVRTLIRKALSVCEKTFKSNSDLLKEITYSVAETLADAYPQIGNNLDKVHYLIDSEDSTLKILQRNALNRWKKIKNDFGNLGEVDVLENPRIVDGLEFAKKKILTTGKRVISDEDAWTLHDTYGVPVHVTEKLALTLGLKFDKSSFEMYERSLKGRNRDILHEKPLLEINKVLNPEVLCKLDAIKLEASDDHWKYDYRVDASGKYVFEKQPATIQAIICGRRLLEDITAEAAEGEEIGLILDRTQLSAQENNRESDTGKFLIENEIIFDIHKVVKVKRFIVHYGTFRHFPRCDAVSTGNIGVLEVDEERRLRLMRNHTALNLLKAAVRKNVFITGEKRSMVTPELLSYNFMVYKNALNLTDLKRMETFVRNAIRHGVSVLRKPLNHRRFYDLEDVACVPGDNQVESEIPVFEVNSGYSLIREYCTGTHVLNTSELEEFVIKKFRNSSYCVKCIEAVIGPEAAAVRVSDNEINRKWGSLQRKLAHSQDPSVVDVSAAEAELKAFAEEVSHHNGISYIVKKDLLKDIQTETRKLKDSARASLRASVRNEMTRFLESSTEKFVLYCLTTESEEDTLVMTTAMAVCGDRPALVFFRRDDLVSAKSSMPPEFITEVFSPENWLKVAMTDFGLALKCVNERSPNAVCYMAKRKLSREQLQRAMDKATDFARLHLPTLK